MAIGTTEKGRSQMSEYTIKMFFCMLKSLLPSLTDYVTDVENEVTCLFSRIDNLQSILDNESDRCFRLEEALRLARSELAIAREKAEFQRRESEKNLPDLNEEEKNLVGSNELIHAIKAYRTRTSAGLKAAKDKCCEYRDVLKAGGTIFLTRPL
jgi:ribosomal protein L7/L12